MTRKGKITVTGLRPTGLRPTGLRPTGLRPTGLRPTFDLLGLRPVTTQLLHPLPLGLVLNQL